MRLVHITDPHLSTLNAEHLSLLWGKRWSGYLSWRNRRRHIHQRAMLDRLTSAIHKEQPQQILVTGDLVHIGLPQEIAEAASWLAELGSPDNVCLVPGNHDIYAADSWSAVQQHWHSYLGLPNNKTNNPKTNYPIVRELADDQTPVRIIQLCSATPTPLLLAGGRLGAQQRRRLRELLKPSGAFHCVLLHHLPLPGMISWRKALWDANALSELFTEQPPPLVLHGHKHRNLMTHNSAEMVILGTASASSVSTRLPASYRVFDLNADRGEWHLHMTLKTLAFDAELPVTIDVQTWRLPLASAAGAH